MIHTIRTVAVGDQESKIDSPIILYRGDREVEVEFTINGSDFTFTNDGNVIKSTNATLGQLVIKTPTGENMFSEVTECNDGKVVFVITKEMIDELIEVGFYSFQIRLFDEGQVSRVTIPPVLKGIDIRNPIAAEDETDLVDIGLVDYAVVSEDEIVIVEGNNVIDTINRTYVYSLFRNSGFSTNNSGEAVIPSGSSSVTVNHGLAITPLKHKIILTPTTPTLSTLAYFVSSVDDVTFTITVNGNVSATTGIAWVYNN